MVGLKPLFADGEVVHAGRVRLTAFDRDCLAEAGPWLEAALAPDWDLAAFEAAVEAGSAVLIADAAGLPLGAAVVLFDAPVAGAATIPFVTIVPERRFRGLGGEASLALERHLRRRFAIERFYAAVPDGRGLAVYFWLRLGYRPLTREEAPWPLAGLTPEPRPGIWLLRDRE